MKYWEVYNDKDELIGGVEAPDSGAAEAQAIEEFGDGVWVVPV